MSFYRWQDFQCTNFGNCSRADLYEIIDLPLGADPVCPECGQAVIPMRPREIVMISPPVNARVRKRRLPWLLAPVAIAALILGLTAGVVWPLMRASERLSLTIPTHVAAQVDDSLQIPLTVEPSQVSGLTFTIKGTLPPGVSLDGSGRRLYGVPQSAGSFYVAITAQAPHLASATAAMGIIIERRPVFLATDLSLQAPSSVQGRVGVPLSIPITISPDSASEPILTMEGSPPPGVTLDAPGKRLLGTPQRPGSYAVIIRASAREYMPAVATVAFTISEALPSPTPAQQVQAPVQAQVKAPVQAQPQPHPTSTPVELPDLIL
ncbi:MAG: hypothetical protein JO069_04095, partial [Verrucomicrobia bacterium]|nr:hypothetical protein [Verrucomicrobiota bacterium]